MSYQEYPTRRLECWPKINELRRSRFQRIMEMQSAGERPLRAKAAAMGVVAVAQTYMGTARNSIINIGKNPVPRLDSMNSGGKKVIIAPAMSTPARNHFPISPSRSLKAYDRPLESLCLRGFLHSPGPQVQLILVSV